MTKLSITVLSGDLRQCYLIDYLRNLGHEVTCLSTIPFSYNKVPNIKPSSLKSAFSHSQLIICPVPFSSDGKTLFAVSPKQRTISFLELSEMLRPGQFLFGGSIPSSFMDTLKNSYIMAYDLMADTAYTKANAALTAEGLLANLISETPFSLVEKKALILGYGRCGTEICRLLSKFKMDLFAMDVKNDCLAEAKQVGVTPVPVKDLAGISFNFDIIINTIPAPTLSAKQLLQLSKNCILFDIASTPGGFDPIDISNLNLKLNRCLSIPGKLMPMAAGELIGKTILERMTTHGF